MVARGRVIILPPLLGTMLVACDPAMWLHLRQALDPVPPLDCFRAALENAPNVVKVDSMRRDPVPERLIVTVRDSLTGKERGGAFTRSGGEIRLVLGWIGPEVIGGPSPDELGRTATIARAALEHAARACAPDARLNVECSINGTRVVSCDRPAA